MSQRAIDWDIAPEGDQGSDAVTLAPAVLPVRRVPITRRVGIVKWYSPPKSYGMVATAGQPCDAIFSIDDVAPGDRPRLNCGQTVSFELVAGPDGHAAKQIRIDATTLPPPPDDELTSKGWR
jgi:cold shock CspA family protein